MRVETLRVGLHPGLDPGTCVCAGGHLHSKATVQNLAGVALGKVRVTGKAFGAGDELLGTATAAVKQATLAPMRGPRWTSSSSPSPGRRSRP